MSVFDYNQRQETLNSNYQKTIYANIILPVLAALSEQWLQEHTYRIKSGLEQARLKGVKIGRPRQEFIKKEKEVLELRFPIHKRVKSLMCFGFTPLYQCKTLSFFSTADLFLGKLCSLYLARTQLLVEFGHQIA